MRWEPELQEKFELMIARIPLFHRGIAKCAVVRKAEENAAIRNSRIVTEKDLISAFFSDVPGPFYSMMIRLLEQSGFDYRRYGFPKTSQEAVSLKSERME